MHAYPPIAALAFCIAAASTAQVTLTDNGKALGVIVDNGQTATAADLAAARDARHIRPAAEELQRYLQQITGAELPLVATVAEAGNRPAIVLQLVDEVPGTSNRPTAKQAYRLVTGDHRLTLSAATPLGLYNAVYGLLEDHLGCRFYTFKRKGLGYAGPGFEVVPSRPTLTVTDIDDLAEPAFANRGVIYWLGSYPWILKNRGIGYPADHTSGALAAGHNMYQLVPPTERVAHVVNATGKVERAKLPGLFATHPEIYPLNREGTREHTWAMGICGTSEALPGLLAAGLVREIEVRTARTRGGEVDWSLPFSAAQGDGFSGCMCADCRALVAREQSEAAPLIVALNKALDIVNASYPRARVITFAYFGTIAAPRSLRPHENLWINVVSSDAGGNSAGDQMGMIADNPANADYARALAAWPRIAPGRVTVWHWDTYRAEWPSMFYVAGNLRYFRDCGLYGVNPQFCGGPWVDLLAWLYLKLAWNPDRDGDALIRQFCADNYGEAAGAHVYEYLQLARSGYAGNLHVPSAVRWSGWTPTTRVKFFPPALLQRMTESLDLALAAADAAADPSRLANLIGARGQSLDVVMLNAVAHAGKPWGAVHFPEDGKDWYVAAADARVPPALSRAKQGIVADGGGEMGVLRSLSSYAGSNGGPLFTVAGGPVVAAVCPDLKGQITSAVFSGTQLLAADAATGGYSDELGRISAQIWLPTAENRELARRGNDDWATVWSDFKQPDTSVLQTDVVLSQPHYGFYPNQFIRRTVSSTAAGLRIVRQFIQRASRGGILRNPSTFNARWRLAMPEPKIAKLAVRGGGIDRLLDLSYAVPGGITTRKAGERMPGADWMDERFDTVIAISAAAATELTPTADATGDLILSFDRGDGLAVVLTTAAADWASLAIKPLVAERVLEISLIGKPLPMSDAAATVDLPAQLLSARRVPVASAGEADAGIPAPVPLAAIRRTGETTATNERDGAELIWIPGGSFVRGSEQYADEAPRRELQLDGFWVYKYPVTLAQYERYCGEAGVEFQPNWGQTMHSGEPADAGSYAVQVNWHEADAYSRWAGVSLPTEAQWEKAARGTDGRAFPWGEEWDAGKCVSYAATVGQFSPGFMAVSAAAQSVSPYGVVATAGNVWEWVADWYGHDYYAQAPSRNPPGPQVGTHKVLRGGCSLYDYRFCRTSARMLQPPQVRDWTPSGFRCVIIPE